MTNGSRLSPTQRAAATFAGGELCIRFAIDGDCPIRPANGSTACHLRTARSFRIAATPCLDSGRMVVRVPVRHEFRSYTEI